LLKTKVDKQQLFEEEYTKNNHLFNDEIQRVSYFSANKNIALGDIRKLVSKRTD